MAQDQSKVEALKGMLTLNLPEKYVPWKPSPRQAAFLLVPHKEAFYGGSAGGGKSIALLMAALQYVENPTYNALILRRTFADLDQPGALISISHEWLGPSDAQWNSSKHQWTFPSGATLKFGHMDSENDKTKYQGAQFNFVGYDELTHFTETMYLYLFSRMRKALSNGVPQRMRSAGNPGGIGHQWVKERFIDPPEDISALTSRELERRRNRTFVRSGLADNPYLDKEDYLESLEELDPVTRAQLMNGDWDVEADGNMFKKEWFDNRIITQLPDDVNIYRYVRYWDLASTDEQKAREAHGGKADYTASCLMGMGDDGNCYILEISRDQMSPAQTEKLVLSKAERDTQGKGKGAIAIWMEQEPGSSGVVTIDHYIRHVLLGYNYRGDRPTGSKIERARPASAAAEQGMIYIIRGVRTNDFLNELMAFPVGTHDDMVDAFSGALAKITESARLGKKKSSKPRRRKTGMWG